MKVILLTIGSHGDVHPFVGLGSALRRRGHDVTVITNGHFEGLARRAGLGFAALGGEQDYRRIIRNRDIWHPQRGFIAIFKLAVLPHIRRSYELLMEHYEPGRTVVVASSLGFAARIAHDKHGIPMASAHLSPFVLRTCHDMPRLPILPLPAWLPMWVRRGIWDGGDRYVLDPLLGPAVNGLRAKLGLPPVRQILKDWWQSPTLVIGFWPEWYGPIQPDWPKQLRLAGFPFYDEGDLIPTPPELQDWLDAGEKPMAFTAGTAMVYGERFFATSVRACVRLGRRGLLLTRHEQQVPRVLPPTVRHVSYMPFGRLLPRCAALVHHGGIGSTAQALRAGVPQLIVPMSHDQFDNAARIERMGTGRAICQREYRASQVVDRLGRLINSLKTLNRCRAVSRWFEQGPDGLERACELLERHWPAAAGAPGERGIGA